MKGERDQVATAELCQALDAVGLPWSELTSRASEIVLFGSRAQQVAREDSDWDLLCVGSSKATRLGKIHLIWKSEEKVLTENWLGSELAGHIAAYGQWLHGVSYWRHRVFVSSAAVDLKRALLKARLRALVKYAQDLPPQLLAHHALRVRRDAQRLCILDSGSAVPSSPVLDQKWNESMSRERWIEICFSLDIVTNVAEQSWTIASSVNPASAA